MLADGVDAVLHFAAKSLVAESVAKPSLYWGHNLGGSLALLEAMRQTGVARIVFSSTAAVYGEPERTPIEETAPARPTSPYGASKLAVDTALAEHARMHKIGAVSLRYFNVAGAAAGPDGRWLGERHNPETHLIPSILAVALGDGAGADGVRLFGDDYPTPDGTCVRDYIHVTDLARAHMLALEACVPGEHRIYNLGSGAGFSNLEVLSACREVTGREIPVAVRARAGPATRRCSSPPPAGSTPSSAGVPNAGWPRWSRMPGSSRLERSAPGLAAPARRAVSLTAVAAPGRGRRSWPGTARSPRASGTRRAG